MEKTTDFSLTIGAAVVAALLIFGGIVSGWYTRQLQQDTAWVTHTLEVLDVSSDLTRRIVDTEVGMRGYVMTGDEHFLEPYHAALPKLEELLARLKEKTKDNPRQQPRLRELEELNHRSLTLRKQVVDLQALDPKAAREIIAERKTKSQMDEIREVIDALQKEERDLLIDRERQSRASYHTALYFIVMNVGLGLAGVTGFVWMVRREIALSRRNSEAIQRQADELAKSNAELEQFAYVASHDLQEPLRAVSGCVQILKKRYGDRLDAGADELIGHSVDGAARMQKLINDLLAYSRVTTRGKDLTRINAGEAFQAAKQNLQVAIAEKQATVTSDKLPYVRADLTQLGLVFQNLIGNAIKFAGDQPTVHVGMRRDDGRWIFSVRDNGIGIAPEYFERIFGVFQRLHTREEYPGTGIGLSICRKIVERHGGRIWLESEPNHGSTFYFTLPDQGTDE